MLGAFTLLLVYQLAGEVLVLVTGLPVPGPVVGMLLLFLSLAARGAAPQWLRESCQGLLAHLSLLFVPAGVGVLLHFQRLGAEWLPIVGDPITFVAGMARVRLPPFLLLVALGKGARYAVVGMVSRDLFG